MEEYIIKRDGEKDLKFKGKVIAGVSSRWIAGQEQTRWTEIDIYKTESGKYVVAEAYITCWQGETDSYNAKVCDTPEEVYDYLVSDDEGTVSNLVKKALEEAAEEDEAFKAFLYEEI